MHVIDTLKKIPAAAIISVAPATASTAIGSSSSTSGDNWLFGSAGGIPYIAGGVILGYIYNLVD
jgi:hypothetical protein